MDCGHFQELRFGVTDRGSLNNACARSTGRAAAWLLAWRVATHCVLPCPGLLTLAYYLPPFLPSVPADAPRGGPGPGGLTLGAGPQGGLASVCNQRKLVNGGLSLQ